MYGPRMIALTWVAPTLLRLMLVLASPFLGTGAGHLETRAPARSPDIVGRASRYGGPSDGRWGGAALACAPDYHVERGYHVCAHRTLPCGTVLAVQAVSTRKTTWCRVMDRGPFGALDPDGVWFPKVGKHRELPGVYRGEIDMAFSAYNELGLKGIGAVRIWKLWVPKGRRNPYKIRPVPHRRTVDI